MNMEIQIRFTYSLIKFEHLVNKYLINCNNITVQNLKRIFIIIRK